MRDNVGHLAHMAPCNMRGYDHRSATLHLSWKNKACHSSQPNPQAANSCMMTSIAFANTLLKLSWTGQNTKPIFRW